MFLLGLDYFMGSGFDDILFNVFKRLTSSWFSQNYSGNYFGTEFNGCTDADLNLAMLGAWIVLSILTVRALYRSAPFLCNGGKSQENCRAID